ncbi:IclR family transcriptional regulator [Nonomuraea cavernae]|uniref:IclR family transcriptional regulator n=1 Tax=Nonomuraea cavernae TaxID=2045107 RepID=A0A918DKJ9_9ACTN|nr:IclR family transcriptional regulator [Nonomuraea cavernae]MCA2187919.1 IclR family transcriptional regulator [Nonomuraea cavernae]GGO72247.1 IclR family transcriptional regulator [Nonomuraea cavernae]
MRSVDHALQLAVLLQVEGPFGVGEAAERLGVAPSTAHRLLAMLVYRDFAIQTRDRRYAAGPVLSLGASSQSRTALLRSVAMPHLAALVERVRESANLVILAGDHVRFIGSVECAQALRVGNREGMVFPAHLASGGKVLLADLPPERLDALYSEAKWAGRLDQRPSLAALRRELRTVRERGFAINAGRTESGVTAVGRPVRGEDGRALAALSVSLPTVRFSRDRLPELTSALAMAVRDVEEEMRGGGAHLPGRR